MSGTRAFFRALAMQLLSLAGICALVLGGQHLFSVIGFELMASRDEMSLLNHGIHAAALLPCAVTALLASRRMHAAFERDDGTRLAIRERAGLLPRGERA